MNLELKKKEIKEEIERTSDEKILWAIARLLHIDDESEVPEWHKNVVNERVEKYEKGNGKFQDWDEAEKKL
ncbi:MAG TPA: addiction module protein [Chitinophagales bacterium]|nr:addiction module protein [Chitinophagales bacterium]